MLLKNLRSNNLTTIENAFSFLKEDPMSKTALQIKERELRAASGDTFRVTVVENTPGSPIFIMSIFPEQSTIDKMLSAIASGKTSAETIEALWKKNDIWTIEIDDTILKPGGMISASEKELTAILLHELGHVAQSNRVTTRIITILQYEYARTTTQTKLMLRDKVFRSIMSVPILNACIGDQKGSNVKEEIRADKFVKKYGYEKQLAAVMDRILRNKNFKASDPDKSMAFTTRHSFEMLNDLRMRQNKLVKNRLRRLQESVPSPYIKEYLGTVYESLFVTENATKNLSGLQKKVLESKKEKYLKESMDLAAKNYYTEFKLFGKKKLDPITQYDLDYIATKITMIRKDSDKLMLLSYIHNKLDMVHFYMDILQDPVESKRYKVPHNLKYLQMMEKQLEEFRMQVLKFTVPPKQPDIFIGYPQGYEG